MAPISAESKVCCGFDSLEIITDMAGLPLSKQHFRKSPALNRGRVQIIDADESSRIVMQQNYASLNQNYQLQDQE